MDVTPELSSKVRSYLSDSESGHRNSGEVGYTRTGRFRKDTQTDTAKATIIEARCLASTTLTVDLPNSADSFPAAYRVTTIAWH